jgi:hypothetical protein
MLYVPLTVLLNHATSTPYKVVRHNLVAWWGVFALCHAG